MWDTLFWIYLANATLLIVHEIDSAYWKEWELFHLPGGPAGFAAIHLPIIFAVLWGAGQIALHHTAGIVVSLVLGASGIIGFCLHAFFLFSGHPEFKTRASLALIGAMLAASLVQVVFSAKMLMI